MRHTHSGRVCSLIFGFRAEESPARAKKQTFCKNDRLSTLQHEVWDWLPIHELKGAEVWYNIKTSGVPYHYAYDRGMTRLSCCFCIFSPRKELEISAHWNPEIYGQFVSAEKTMNHSFRKDLKLSDINPQPIRVY